MINLAQYIEQTFLKQDATQEELSHFLSQAEQHRFFGVCIPPCYVGFAKQHLAHTNIKIITVIGFPLGYSTSEVKAFEAGKAIQDGADEIDMVLNISAFKSKNWDFVLEDMETVKKACGQIPLKVIIETDLLTKAEIEKACLLCIEAKVDFVKTSTGFVKNGIGAKAEDVALISQIVKPYGIKVKASGGIKTKQQAEIMISAGADRIGTSAGIQIVE